MSISSSSIIADKGLFKAAFKFTKPEASASLAFDGGVGEVSGMWVIDKKPMTKAGIIISIMVDDAEAARKLVT